MRPYVTDRYRAVTRPKVRRERAPTEVEARIDSQELDDQPVKAGTIGSSPTVVVGSVANVVVLAGGAVVLVEVEDVGTVVVLVVVDEVGGGSACNSNAPISTVPFETRSNPVPR